MMDGDTDVVVQKLTASLLQPSASIGNATTQDMLTHIATAGKEEGGELDAGQANLDQNDAENVDEVTMVSHAEGVEEAKDKKAKKDVTEQEGDDGATCRNTGRRES